MCTQANTHTQTHTLHKRTQELREDHDQQIPGGTACITQGVHGGGGQHSIQLEAENIYMLPVPCQEVICGKESTITSPREG